MQMNPIFPINNYNMKNPKFNLISVINSPVKVNSHPDPLLYCFAKIRGFTSNIGNPSWRCNECEKIYTYEIPSFYCTFCDYNLCPNCFGNNIINEVEFFNYNDMNNQSIKMKTGMINNWNFILPNHNHGLVLVEKVNKNFMWKCNFCQNNYGNNILFFYCSLCNLYLCQKCANNQNNIINPNKNSISIIFKGSMNNYKTSIPIGTIFSMAVNMINLPQKLNVSPGYQLFYQGIALSMNNNKKVEEIFNINQDNVVIVNGNFIIPNYQG